MMHAQALASLFIAIWFSCLAAVAGEDDQAKTQATQPEPSFVYRAELVRVIDGDTVVMNIDLGFGVWKHNEHLRLIGVEAPEVRGPEKEEGAKWKAKLEELLAGKTDIVIQTVKDKKEKYGRYLVTIWADGVDVNAAVKVLSGGVTSF